jgi:hypothetical protein
MVLFQIGGINLKYLYEIGGKICLFLFQIGGIEITLMITLHGEKSFGVVDGRIN